MAIFPANPKRLDPYKNFKFRLKWDGQYVAAVSKRSALKRTTEVVEHRNGGDPSMSHKSPGRQKYEAITLERGLLSKSYREFDARDIRSVEIDQGILARMVGIGDLTISTAATVSGDSRSASPSSAR